MESREPRPPTPQRTGVVHSISTVVCTRKSHPVRSILLLRFFVYPFFFESHEPSPFFIFISSHPKWLSTLSYPRDRSVLTSGLGQSTFGSTWVSSYFLKNRDIPDNSNNVCLFVDVVPTRFRNQKAYLSSLIEQLLTVRVRRFPCEKRSRAVGHLATSEWTSQSKRSYGAVSWLFAVALRARSLCPRWDFRQDDELKNENNN